MNAQLQHDVWQRAVGACLAVDEFRRTRSPEVLQELQAELVRGIRWVESRLRRLKARSEGRKERITRLVEAEPAIRRQLGPHHRELSLQVDSLKHQRNVLRQVGDAVAWSILRDDPSLVSLLWMSGRNHHLPEGIGLIAPVQVLEALHSTGDFYAVYNDLTRCLAVGDITVVSASGRWISPLAMELKSSWVDEENGICEVDFLSPYSDHQEFEDLFRAVRASLGLKDREDAQMDDRAQRQVDELMERTNLLHRMQLRLATKLDRPGENHWKNLESVLHRAYTTGVAFDVPEDGLAFFGVRVHENQSAAPQLQSAIDRLEKLFPLEERGDAVSTSDLAQHERIATLVPPVLLWPITGDLRNALLAGRLFFGVRIAQDLWLEAFTAEGIDLDVRETEWLASYDGQVAQLDQLEIWKLQLGVALAGVSPSAVAQSLRSAMDNRDET